MTTSSASAFGDSGANSSTWLLRSITRRASAIMCIISHVKFISRAVFILKLYSVTCLCVHLKGATNIYEAILTLTNYFRGAWY